mgnify:CR=1 FL=1
MFNFTPPKLTTGNALKGVAIAALLTVAGTAGATTSHDLTKSAKKAPANVILVASADRDRASNRRERRTDRRTDRRRDRDDRTTDRRRDRDDRRTDRRSDRDDRRTDRRRTRTTDVRRDRRRDYRPTTRRRSVTTHYRPRRTNYGYRVSNGNRGYRTNYRSGLGISFSFGTPGYSRYRWASSPYFGYRSAYGSYGYYRSRTYCQRVVLEAWRYGRPELVSVKQCSNPWDGTYIVQGSERLVGYH